MSDVDALVLEQAKAARAKRLLEDLNPYLQTIEESLLEGFKGASSTNVELLRDIKIAWDLLQRLKHDIESVVNSGKFARKELETLKRHG